MAREERYLDFLKATEEIQKLNFVPDLLKSPVGKNFRAISETAILEVINPILNKYLIDYCPIIKSQNLEIKEVSGKLVFVATCVVRLDFYISGQQDPIAFSEALGMGIDDGDKAMGKAYTYAVKYAILKKFRIRYSDDPDATESKPIETGAQEEKKEKPKKSKGNKEKESSEPLITEKMSNYIIGLVKKLDIPDEKFKKEWGYYPSSEKIPMKLAREIIEQLKELDDGLPF